ncbi:MAG TPA: hypothetical protein VK832_05490 [Burkholderiaceae bacterium]|jgi:hypothetical protein|nr:hypothetical protein [Burkholderiaceae bacterium]
MRTIKCNGKMHTYDETKVMPALDKFGNLIEFVPLRDIATMDADDPKPDWGKRLADVLTALAKDGSDLLPAKVLVDAGMLKSADVVKALCARLGLSTEDGGGIPRLEGWVTAHAGRSESGLPATDAVATMDGSRRVDPNSSVGRYLAGVKPDYSGMSSVEKYLMGASN